MSLWYLAPPKDDFFKSGKKAASSAELQSISAYLMGLQESGFHIYDRVKAVKKELNERLNSRTGTYGR
jgi:hypothetical protein